MCNGYIQKGVVKERLMCGWGVVKIRSKISISKSKYIYNIKNFNDDLLSINNSYFLEIYVTCRHYSKFPRFLPTYYNCTDDHGKCKKLSVSYPPQNKCRMKIVSIDLENWRSMI